MISFGVRFVMVLFVEFMVMDWFWVVGSVVVGNVVMYFFFICVLVVLYECGNYGYGLFDLIIFN